MIIDIVMPKMGESITDGTILEWRKKVGDVVELDEILLEIGTDKVDSEIPSSAAGKVIEILAKPNDVIDVGNVIARIDSSDNVPGDIKKTIITPSENFNQVQKQKSDPLLEKTPLIEVSAQKKTGFNKKRFYTPIVLKIAMEESVSFKELEEIEGSGNNGRVTKKDILLYLENKKSVFTLPTIEEPFIELEKSFSSNSSYNEEMPKMRKLIATHMKKSLETSAHVYLMTEVDMTRTVNFVKKNEETFLTKEKFKLTYTPFIVDAVVRALMEFPDMNASLFDSQIEYHKNINIGLAVAVEKGLLVPSILSCEEKNFLGICRSINDMASKARNNKLSMDEIEGSTFSITNFGVFGMSFGTPIINQPNVGILGVGAIKKQPVVIESNGVDAIAIRSIMMLSLGFDHRLIDGAGGSNFLNKVRLYLEEFNTDILGGFNAH